MFLSLVFLIEPSNIPTPTTLRQAGAVGYSPRSQSGREQGSGIPRASSSPNVQATTPRSGGMATRPKSQMFVTSTQPSPAKGGRETSAEGRKILYVHSFYAQLRC